jgi:uncharacterized protein Yka (UPF0111/DUF47 family)
MFRLIPREVRFFDLFERQSEHIIKAAQLLRELVHNFADARAKAHSIKEVEHQGYERPWRSSPTAVRTWPT